MRRHENTTTTIFTHTIYMMILCGPTESNKYKFQKYDYHTWLLYSNDSFRISLSLFSLAVVVVVLWVVGFFMRAAISYLFATKHHFSYGCWTLSWFCVLNNGQFSFFYYLKTVAVVTQSGLCIFLTTTLNVIYLCMLSILSEYKILLFSCQRFELISRMIQTQHSQLVQRV